MGDLPWGLQMTAVGMGLVFGLLALLWGLLALALRLDKPEPEPAVEPVPAVQVQAEDPGLAPPDAALLAAITAAVLAHSRARRAEAAPLMRAHWPGSLLHASRWVAAGRTRQTHSWHRRR